MTAARERKTPTVSGWYWFEYPGRLVPRYDILAVEVLNVNGAAHMRFDYPVSGYDFDVDYDIDKVLRWYGPVECPLRGRG